MTTTPADFNEWLNECPLQWFRDGISDDTVSYTFILTDDEEDDEDC